MHSVSPTKTVNSTIIIICITYYSCISSCNLCVDYRDYPLLLIEEYMNHGDLLGVLKDSRPSMPLTTQLTYAYHVADGMDYLANEL